MNQLWVVWVCLSLCLCSRPLEGKQFISNVQLTFAFIALIQSSSAADSCEPVKLIWLFSLAKVLRVADAPEGRKKSNIPFCLNFWNQTSSGFAAVKSFADLIANEAKWGRFLCSWQWGCSVFWLALPVLLVAFPAGQRCQSLSLDVPKHTRTDMFNDSNHFSFFLYKSDLLGVGGGIDGCLGSVSVMQ